MEKTFTFSGIDQQDILGGIARGLDLPCLAITEYPLEQLQQIAQTLLEILQKNLLSSAGMDMDNIQEQLDQLHFQAKKDSTTSSMRPSSDMYGRKAAASEDNPETGSAKSASASEEIKGRTEEEPDSANTEDSHTGTGDLCEEESEKKLREDHDRSLRKSSGRKPGKQPGTPGTGFHVPDHIDKTETVIIPPNKCKDCPNWKSCCKAKAKAGTRHNIYDIEFTITCTTYQNVEVQCPEQNNETLHSDYPENAKGVNQYGISIATLVSLLYCVGMVSFNRIKQIIAPMIGIQLSTATIEKYVHSLADKVRGCVDRILEVQNQEKVVHCDETGANVDGKLHWIHTISCQMYTFVSIQAKRGKEGMDAIGFLTAYTGTVVHDCLSSYWNYTQCLHAVCDAHIERELAGIAKFFKNADQWANDMIRLLQEMLHAKHLAQEAGKTALDSDEISIFFSRYDDLIERGKSLHPIPERQPEKRGRPKKGRARSLVDRMELRKEDILRFLTDFDVPYTNNLAEGSFRMLSTKRNVGIFRTLEGAEDFCAIWSYVSTAKKHGISYYNAIREAFLGNSMKLIFPDEETVSQNSEISPDIADKAVA